MSVSTITPYTDAELERLLRDLESDLVERKRSASDRTDVRRTICAFANDLPGSGRVGVIFVGVENDGSCANITVSDELLSTIAQMRGDGSMLPMPTMAVQKRRLAGCDVAVVFVAPSEQPPVRLQGRVLVKVGPTVQQASPEEERRLGERRRAGDLPFDLRPAVSADLGELDMDYFRSQYLPRAIAAEVLEQNRREISEQIESLRLALGGVPTYGALIALGRDPQRWVPGAWVQFLRVGGLEITDPIRDQKALTGRLEDVLRQLDEVLKINVSMRTEVATAPRESRRPDYPLSALQQLTRNAIMHRNYDGTNAPVRVYWYDDRVEIQSPGGLYGRMTPQNFGAGATDYRNPLVAEAMVHLGFSQRFGLGIPLTRQALADNGNPPPDFAFETNAVGVTVRAAA